MSFMPETQSYRPQNSTMLQNSQLAHAAADAGGLTNNHSHSQVTANNLSGPLISIQQPGASTYIGIAAMPS